MPKAETKEKNDKRSRTLYMSDSDWQALTELADLNGRSRGQQIVMLVRAELGKKK